MQAELTKIGVYEVIYHGLIRQSEWRGLGAVGGTFQHVNTCQGSTLEAALSAALLYVESKGYDHNQLRDRFIVDKVMESLTDHRPLTFEEPVRGKEYEYWNYVTIMWS